MPFGFPAGDLQQAGRRKNVVDGQEQKERAPRSSSHYRLPAADEGRTVFPSSPRKRGYRPLPFSLIPANTVIPAQAGISFGVTSVKDLSSCHPRASGDLSGERRSTATAPRSSPRKRESLVALLPAIELAAVIPAQAGISIGAVPPPPSHTLRTRIDRRLLLLNPPVIRTSSPRACTVHNLHPCPRLWLAGNEFHPAAQCFDHSNGSTTIDSGGNRGEVSSREKRSSLSADR